MKRIILMTLAICLLFSSVSIKKAFAADWLDLQVPPFTVKINGQIINNEKSKYPFLFYRDIVYMPLSWDISALMGLHLNWEPSYGLDIKDGFANGTIKQDWSGNNAPSGVFTAEVASYPIFVDDTLIENNSIYPIVNYKNITYLPLTWSMAHETLGWNIQWDHENGLSIISSQQRILGRIVYDDKEYLYVTEGYDFMHANTVPTYRFNKLLNGKYSILTRQMSTDISEKIENLTSNMNAISSLQEFQEKDSIEIKNKKLYFNEIELDSLQYYEDLNDKYFESHPNYVKSPVILRKDYSKVVKLKNEFLVFCVISHSTRIPPPYTPTKSEAYLISGQKVVKLGGFNANDSKYILNTDDSFWLIQPIYWSKSMVNLGRITFVDSHGEVHSVNEMVNANYLEFLGNMNGNFYFSAYDYATDQQKDSAGIYRLNTSMQVEKLHPFISETSYLASDGNIYAVSNSMNENRITNLVSGNSYMWFDFQFDPDTGYFVQLIEKSLNLQYNRISEDLTKIYTKDFIESINETFYQDKLSPYKIIEINYMGKNQSTDEVVIRVSLQDKMGSYIQEFTFKKYVDSYLISDIGNDT